MVAVPGYAQTLAPVEASGYTARHERNNTELTETKN